MKNIGRAAVGFSVAVLTAVAGSASAWAWTWARSDSPLKVSSDGLLRGGGYGSATATAYSQGRLSSYLSDSRRDGMRTFVDLYGTSGPQSGIGTQSGRRSDGGTAYAKMADQYFYAEYPKGVGQYYYYVKVCMDRSWSFDPCSSTRTDAGL